MSTPELHVIEGGGVDEAMEKLLADARLMHEHRQVDRWRLGDDAVEVVRKKHPDAFPRAGKADSGLGKTLEKISADVQKVAPTITTKVVATCFDTARAWPEEQRLYDKASFSAHKVFNAARFDNRRAKLLRDLADRSSTGYVVFRTAQLRAGDDITRPPVKTPLDKTEVQLAATLRRLWNPVDRVGPDDRKAVGLILRRLAASFETGDFK